MKKTFILVLALTSVFTNNANAQFDTTVLNKFTVYFFLTSQDSVKKNEALKYVADSTSTIDPFTLTIAGAMLYTKGYQDSSMYWLYLGDIRARFLSSLFKKRSDAALYASIQSVTFQIKQDYAKNNVQTLYKKINQALEFDSLNPLKPLEFEYPPNDTSQYIPIEQWAQRYRTVRQTFHHLEEDILQNGSSIFEDDTKKKAKPK